MATYLVTADPPTPNGDLHVGHLSGPFLAADVFCRFQRMIGNRTVCLSSSDGHQSYVMTTAKRLGCTPHELVDEATSTIVASLRQADIHFDHFTNAVGNQQHVAVVQDFFRSLHERGVLVARDHRTLFCGACNQVLFSAFVYGGCPYCGERAAGNLCEACGRVYDPIDLVEPRCTTCDGVPEPIEYRGLFLPLERHREKLKAFYAGRRTWRAHTRALCDALLARPLVDFPASHPSSWGVPVPIKGYEDQVINVWIEMYPGYRGTTRAWAEGIQDPGLADRLWAGGATLVQFLGYDNSFCNGVVHAALSLTSAEPSLQPEHVITNEFYLLGESKFSTSRGHVIWGQDILRTVDASVLRYHLARTNPEYWQTSFSYDELERTWHEELDGEWNIAIETVFQAIADPPLGPRSRELDLATRGLMGAAASRLESVYDLGAFSLRDASVALLDYVAGCRQYAIKTREQIGPEESHAEDLATLLKALALFAAPLMPGFAQQLWEALGLDGHVSRQEWSSYKTPIDSAPGSERVAWFPPPTARPSRAAANG